MLDTMRSLMRFSAALGVYLALAATPCWTSAQEGLRKVHPGSLLVFDVYQLRPPDQVIGNSDAEKIDFVRRHQKTVSQAGLLAFVYRDFRGLDGSELGQGRLALIWISPEVNDLGSPQIFELDIPEDRFHLGVLRRQVGGGNGLGSKNEFDVQVPADWLNIGIRSLKILTEDQNDGAHLKMKFADVFGNLILTRDWLRIWQVSISDFLVMPPQKVAKTISQGDYRLPSPPGILASEKQECVNLLAERAGRSLKPSQSTHSFTGGRFQGSGGRSGFNLMIP